MQRWKCKSYKQIFTLDENLIKHVKEGRCAGGITKIISSGSKLRHILNSSKKVFYGSDKKLSYTACQWNKAEVADIGNRIHHKMCGMVEKTYSLIHYYLFFLFFNVDMKYVTVKLNTSTPAQSRFRGFKFHSGQQLSIATLNNNAQVLHNLHGQFYVLRFFIWSLQLVDEVMLFRLSGTSSQLSVIVNTISE